MAVQGLHDRDFCPDAVESHDAIHPPALDRPVDVPQRAVSPDDKPADDEVGLDGEPRLLFIRVPEVKTLKNRVHLDLQPDTTRDEEVDRLTGLGARLVDDQRRSDGSGWVVLTDPAGNEFCVERSAAERA